MKILSEGKKWSTTCKCVGIGIEGGGCGATLEVEAEDIYAISVFKEDETPDFMYGRSEYCYTFKCPCCNIEAEICGDKLPINVKRQALDRIKKSAKVIRLTKNGRMYL